MDFVPRCYRRLFPARIRLRWNGDRLLLRYPHVHKREHIGWKASSAVMETGYRPVVCTPQYYRTQQVERTCRKRPVAAAVAEAPTAYSNKT